MVAGLAVGPSVVAGGEICAVVAAGVGVIRTSWGVVPGEPGTLVTRALDVALRPSGVVEGDDPEVAGAHAATRAVAHTMRAPRVVLMPDRGIRK